MNYQFSRAVIWSSVVAYQVLCAVIDMFGVMDYAVSNI
jgi:hypothetical protein